MSFDFSWHEPMKDFFLQWLEGRGETLVYMRRFNSNFNNGLCPRCTDIDEKVETDPNCPVCFGTGFFGGWSLPITGINSPYQRVYGIFSFNTVITDWDQSGPVTTEQDQKLSIAIIDQPALGDLVIDSKGSRYRVGVNTLDWTFNNDHVGWHITVNQVYPPDMLYNVPVAALNVPNLSQSQSNYSSLLQLQINQFLKLELEIVNF